MLRLCGAVPVPYRAKQQAFNPRFARGLFVVCLVSRHCSFQNRALKGALPSGPKGAIPKRATAKAKVLGSGFLGRFFAPSKNTPKTGRFDASYDFPTSDIPIATRFLDKPSRRYYFS